MSAYSQLQVQNGRIVNQEELQMQNLHGIYGGVELAIPPPTLPTAEMRAAPVRPQAIRSRGLRVVSTRVRPQGVDLDLGQFDLSETTEVAKGAQAGAWTQSFTTDGVVDVGAFWSSLEGQASASLAEKDRSFLGAIFNPKISDRRDDGECFVPPDTSFTYVEGLRKLLKEEERVRQQRKECFLSATFSTERPGALFPSSWTSTIEVQGSAAQAGHLQLRTDYTEQSGALVHALHSATPTFDKVTEDGFRFRVYKMGSLEVRTTQEVDGTEVVGAVFSVCGAAAEGGHQDGGAIEGKDRLARLACYVEQGPQPHYYVVLETSKGNAVVTEQLSSGALTWEENPKHLKDRNSLGKVMWSSQCRGCGVTVADLQAHRAKEQLSEDQADRSSKAYARGINDFVTRRMELQRR